MARTKRAVKREIASDPVYQNRLIAQLINKVMKEGKKTVAQRIVYGAFDRIKTSGQDPVAVFEAAVSNVAPKVEVRPRRVGGASYQIPVEVRGERRDALSLRWILAAASVRSSKEYPTFAQKLAAELLEAASGAGAAVKKKEDTHRMAEANKAFAHFRW